MIAPRLLPAITLLATLSGCGALRVDYGKVPHADYTAHVRCAQTEAGNNALAESGLFLVTSRLPDCRTADIVLLNHRSPQVRYGRFVVTEAAAPPLAFQEPRGWWADLETAARAKKGRVLLYVHGYRETFASTARDTAQMARLTGFDGPTIAYAWPSQGAALQYAVDETNMYWDERNFRTFLSTLARQPWVTEIVVVAHSLGTRLVIPSIEHVDRTSASADASNIANIILASPDVDREDFERDIAEEVLALRRVNRDRRITIYASARDKALALSHDIHGYPRLGSPACFDPAEARALKDRGLPIRCYAGQARAGLTIIDTSDVSRGTAGHSDFLRAGPACADFAAVANGSRTGKGRLPTHLPHVFRLSPEPKADGKNGKQADEDQRVCRRDGRD